MTDLNLTAIAAYLFRTVVHASGSLRIRHIGARERMLILGRPVTNPLLRTIAVCWADFAAGGAGRLLALFVLTWSPARLARVDE